ncbi:hypothetical protein CHS0354_013685 [Potamilus streckersoni]|uniref:Uncharacterized protein n=1 Tax=Potamilus streckersoni TaxID=2493646 RepID=A0AAE0SEX5_9BIVA|nr:hypothetical protein CHS0354_013685 [Potamilus streckersoni]
MPVLIANGNADNEYENALSVRQFGADVHVGDGNVYENRSDVDMRPLRNSCNLIYADLELANPTAHNGTPIIHGLENLTEYAEIAFGKRGEPISDSDEENELQEHTN